MSSRVGPFFFVFATAWIAATALLLQPDPPGGLPAAWPAVNLPSSSGFAVSLPSQEGGAVSWIRPQDGPARYISEAVANRDEDRFIMTMLGLPVALAAGLLAWLAASNWLRRRGVSGISSSGASERPA